jgi:hypothetical protein
VGGPCDINGEEEECVKVIGRKAIRNGITRKTET